MVSSDDFPRTSQFEHYLGRSGWTRSEGAIIPTWTTESRGELLQVVVPTSTDRAEYNTLAREALRTIAYAEQRPSVDIWNDILLRGADTLAFRYSPNVPSGQAPLPLAEDALKNIRNLLTGSASALYDDRAVLPNRRPAPAEHLSEQVRIGVAKGSFVVRATIPLADDALEDAQYDASLQLSGATFARRVTRRVVQSLQTAQRLASEVERSGRIEAFSTGDRAAPVNATELQALAGLGGPANEPYEMRYSVSPLDKDDGASAGKLTVTHGQQLLFEEAAEYLKKRQPREEIVLEGRVILLRRESKLGPGRITVDYADPDLRKKRRVQVELSEDDYRSALRAHDSGLTVSIRGTLARSRTWRLLDPHDFAVQESE